MDNLQGRRVRFVMFRAGAVLFGLTLLVLVEVGVRLFPGPIGGVGLEDPYVSFEGVRPLFVADASGERFETSSERLTFFQRLKGRIRSGCSALVVLQFRGGLIR